MLLPQNKRMMKFALVAGAVIGLAAVAARVIAAPVIVGRALAAPAPAPTPAPQGGDVVLPENATMRVSDHVWVIMGFPNIGIVVGNRATLVVDTGLGPRNGAIAAREAAKLSKNPNQLLYLTTTHYHPEHASGEGGFPANTVLIRDAVQQKEVETEGMSMVKMFAANAQMRDLLAPVTAFRAPDVVFDKEATLDLGGVTARLFWWGTAHTLGDEMIYVEPDHTLLPGDIVMNKVLPSLYGPDARLDNWIKILDQLRSLPIVHIVPDHNALGDAPILTQEFTLLSALQTRALELKRQGKSADEAGQTLLAEFSIKFSDWPNLSGIPGLVKHIYSENP
jgi:glyoxylase-like metal-dependent hydrolase (beta-lactamase superfamily II)